MASGGRTGSVAQLGWQGAWQQAQPALKWASGLIVLAVIAMLVLLA